MDGAEALAVGCNEKTSGAQRQRWGLLLEMDRDHLGGMPSPCSEDNWRFVQFSELNRTVVIKAAPIG